ncbi:MAG: YfhO family protein [Candidatus Hydrogenedentes bacterium]|nr:YfhO family protein [Candidatus Hydrogenedentota bacterium]
MNLRAWTVNRYAFEPLFLLALLLVAAAPIYWYRTEMLPSALREAHDNLDLYQEVYPGFHYGFSRLRQGDFPLWNSKQLCGIPFQADPRSGLFQPLNLIFLHPSTETALVLHAFTCLFLRGTFFIFFARALELRYLPALIGAIIYAFCGASTAGMSRPGVANALTLTPFVFWAAREYLETFRYRNAVLVGLGAALLLIAGSPAVSVAQLLLLIPYILVLTLFPVRSLRPPLPARAKMLGVVALVALTLSAVQWLPTLFWVITLDAPGQALWRLDLSARAPSKTADLVLQLLIAKPGSLPRLAYLGIATLMLLPAALFHRKRRDMIYFSVAAAAFGGLILLEPARVPAAFPPSAFAFPAVFAIAVLAAMGVDRLLAPRISKHDPKIWAPAGAVLAAAAALFLMCGAQARGFLIVAAALIILFIVARLPGLSSATGFALASLLFLDFAGANANTNRHPYRDVPSCYDPNRPALQLAEEQALKARVLISTLRTDVALPENAGMLFPIDVAGGAGLPLTRDLSFWWSYLNSPNAAGLPTQATVAADARQPKLINVMAARVTVAAPSGPLASGIWKNSGPRLRELRAPGETRVYINEDALPRAFWVPTWRLVESLPGAIAALTDPAMDTSQTCTIDRTSPGVVDVQPGPAASDLSLAAAECSLTELSPEHITIHVKVPAEGMVVLSDTFARGWHATLNGRRALIYRANGIFRGVYVPAGEHEMVFRYRPFTLVLGATITMLTLVSLAGLGVVLLIRRR